MHCEKQKEIDSFNDFANEMRPLIPTLKKIVEAEEAKTWLSIRVANALKFVGIVIGIFGTIFAIVWQVTREIRK